MPTPAAKFSRITRRITLWLGSPTALILNVSIVVVWAVVGLIKGFSDTHQLFINTFTTIWTYMMVTVLQNTQNRDSKAIHMKLNELLSVKAEARNELIALEEAEDEKLDAIAQGFEELKRDCESD